MKQAVHDVALDRLAAAVSARLSAGRPEPRVDPVWRVVEVTVPSHPDGAVVAAAVTDGGTSCAVVRYAHHRARDLERPLRVVHVWNRGTPRGTDMLLATILHDCLSPADASAAEREILHDRDPGRALRALSNEAALIVVSPVSNSSGGRILGDTVVSLIGHTACPLALVLPPPGRSPAWWRLTPSAAGHAP